MRNLTRRPFVLDGSGKPLPSQENTRLAVKKLGVKVFYDNRADILMWQVPQDITDALGGMRYAIPGKIDQISSRTSFRSLIEQRFGFVPSPEVFRDALISEGIKHPLPGSFSESFAKPAVQA